MDDGAGDDKKAPEPGLRAPARTLLLRIWAESDPPEPVVRGTLSDLSGKKLGAFGSIQALWALLERLLSQPRR